MPTQRDYMRQLVDRLGPNMTAVCRAYAQGEIRGEVRRDRNESDLEPLAYAEALWKDGTKKGWLKVRKNP